MRTMLLPLALWVTASCAPAPDAYVFRNDDRPAYTRTASVDELKAMAPDAVTILDVRLSEDFAASPTMILGASQRDPEAITDWASKLLRDKPSLLPSFRASPSLNHERQLGSGCRLHLGPEAQAAGGVESRAPDRLLPSAQVPEPASHLV